jgi:hypothetical protein
LLNNAVGQKFEDNGDIKIAKQVISETTYTFYKKRNGTKCLSEHTDMQWNSVSYFQHYIVKGNDKLTVCRFNFHNEVNWYYHVEGKTDYDKYKAGSVEFYILTKDYYEFVELMDKFIKY